MLIVCPNCASSYEVRPESLGAAGRSVRCARCRSTWFAAQSAAPRKALMATTDQAAPPAGGPAQIEGGEFGWTSTPEAGEPVSDQGRSAATQAAGLDAEPVEPDPNLAADDSAPITVPDAPALVPVLDQDPPAPPPAEDHEAAGNVETLAARRAKRAARHRREQARSRLPIVIVALVVVIAGLLAARTQVVRLAPQTASLYGAIGLPVNLRGLVFENVKTTRETSDGVTVLVVEGTIVNVTPRPAEVPRLRFGVRDGAGLEIYAWTGVPARTVLAPEEALEFRSRLASPPAEARDVIVRFFNRRDIVAGGH